MGPSVVRALGPGPEPVLVLVLVLVLVRVPVLVLELMSELEPVSVPERVRRVVPAG